MSKTLRHFLDISELPLTELRNMLAASAATSSPSASTGTCTATAPAAPAVRIELLVPAWP